MRARSTPIWKGSFGFCTLDRHVCYSVMVIATLILVRSYVINMRGKKIMVINSIAEIHASG